jgi:transcriptional regulator with XRE-family HTH domain
MANENLKNALHDAGLTSEALAEIVQVDPKTVQRWVAGKATPYRRHRAKIAQALNLIEQQLWPEDNPPPASRPEQARRGGPDDVIACWAQVTDPRVPDYRTFLAQAVQRIDVLDSGGHLPQELIELLRGRALEGCEVRVLTRATINVRDTGTLGGIALRALTGWTMQTLFRADEEMLFTIPLSVDSPPALLHLRRLTPDGIFTRIENELQQLWDSAQILHQPPPTQNKRRSRAATPAASSLAGDQHDPVIATQGQARRWPRQPT